MKTSSDVVHPPRKFYAQANMLLRNSVIAPMMANVCYSSNFVLMCTVALFGLTPLHLVLKSQKLKTSYNSALRNLLLIKKPYSASTMFVTHGIPSFYELLCTSIYRFTDRVSKNSNYYNSMHDSYILFIFTLPFDNGGDQYIINLHYFIL